VPEIFLLLEVICVQFVCFHKHHLFHQNELLIMQLMLMKHYIFLYISSGCPQGILNAIIN